MSLGHHYVGTEHLLLGLTRTDDPDIARAVAIGILRTLGVDLEQVRTNVVQVLAGKAMNSAKRWSKAATALPPSLA